MGSIKTGGGSDNQANKSENDMVEIDAGKWLPMEVYN